MGLTSKYRAFIWDFDGTLYDTYPFTVRAYAELLSERGAVESAAVIERLARISLGELERYLREKHGVGDDFFSAVAARALELTLAGAEAFPDAADFVADVAEAGGMNMLYTHRDENALVMLRRGGMARYFADAVCDGDPDFAWKPAPDAILALVRRNGVSPGEAIMIGDREIDVLSAANAGIGSALIMPYDISADTVATYKCADFAALRAVLGGGDA